MLHIGINVLKTHLRLSMLVFPAMSVHGHWDPVIHTAELLQQSLAQAVGWPWVQGKDRDTLVVPIDVVLAY